MNLRSITLATDKANHLVWGFVLALAVATLATRMGYPRAAAPAGATAALLAGLAKEAWDWWANRRAAARGEAPPHSVEVGDLAATLWGGLAMWAAVAWVGVGRG